MRDHGTDIHYFPCLGNSQELTRLSRGGTKYLVLPSDGKFMLRKTGVSAWIPGNCYFHSFIHSFTHQTILEHCVGHSMVGFFPPSVQFSHLVMSDSVTPWTAACQASLSITNSQSSLKPMSIKSVMPSSHLILCRLLLLLPPIPPSIRVFSNESTLHMKRPKYWSFSFSIIPSKEHPGLISKISQKGGVCNN